MSRQENDHISRQAAINEAEKQSQVDGAYGYMDTKSIVDLLNDLPAAGTTLREQALMLLLNWAVECDFGYDNFPEQYERYKDEVENMSYIDGMIYIAEKEVERSEKGYGL